jgi:hypothetical protein
VSGPPPGRRTVDSTHPLARAATAVRARDEHQVIELGRPDSPAWFRLADLYADGAVAAELDWAARADGDTPLPRDVAASYLASWIDSCVLGPAATLLVLEGVLPDVTPDNLWLRRHATDRWYDRISYERPAFRCTADHAAAGHPDAAVVADRAELVAALADAAVALLTPLFAAVRARASYGLRGMWGSLADDLAGTLTWITRRSDGDATEQRLVWRATEEILDAVAARAPLLRVRPTVVDVEWSAGCTLFSRRGTCCLYYKTPDALLHAEADRYCTSCPLRDPDEQREQWVRWLESASPAG